MASFLDGLTSKVSRTMKQASDSAKVLADKNRVKKDIAAIENELRSRFRDIGEKYFEETENPSPEYAELFQSIRDLRESLAAKQHELEELDGTTTCPGCGKTISRDVRFCSFCGTPLPAPAPAAPEAVGRTCAVCGAPLAADAAFCASCGNRAPVNAEPAAPAPVPTAPQALYCPNCGESLSPDAIMCPNCGTKAPGIN